MTRRELTGVPGAPWTVRCEGVVWVCRAGAAAVEALAPGLRKHRPVAVVGGILRYHETPVGGYDEVLGMVVCRERVRPWGSVAFMAVSSEAGLVGGRVNWSLPKTLAELDGVVADRATLTARSAAGSSWQVSGTPRAVGPAVPVAGPWVVRQQFPDGRVGRSRLTARGRIRPAVVTVTVDSDGPLPRWLRPGRHLGAVVRSAAFTLEGPTFP